MFATNHAVMGALLFSSRSYRAYWKQGMTAVISFAEAMRHALMVIKSSINMSFTGSDAVRITHADPASYDASLVQPAYDQ